MWIILQWNQTAKLFSNGNRKSLEWRLDDKLLHELSELDSNHRTWNYPFSKTDCTHPAVCGWYLSWFTIFFHHCCLLLIFLISKNCNEISKEQKKALHGRIQKSSPHCFKVKSGGGAALKMGRNQVPQSEWCFGSTWVGTCEYVIFDAVWKDWVLQPVSPTLWH